MGWGGGRLVGLMVIESKIGSHLLQCNRLHEIPCSVEEASVRHSESLGKLNTFLLLSETLARAKHTIKNNIHYCQLLPRMQSSELLCRCQSMSTKHRHFEDMNETKENNIKPL